MGGGFIAIIFGGGLDSSLGDAIAGDRKSFIGDGLGGNLGSSAGGAADDCASDAITASWWWWQCVDE